MVGTPLAIDIGPGAVDGARAAARRPPDLERRPRGGRRRARPGRGDRRRRCAPRLDERGDLDHGRGRQRRGRDGPRRRSCATASTTRSSASAAAARSTWRSTPRRSAACRWSPSRRRSRTTASPRRSRRWRSGGRKGSFGVQMPIAVVVDLDYVRRSEPGACAAPGIGDAISNLSAIADWRLAERERGEAVDGARGRRSPARRRWRSSTASDGDRRRRVPDRARRGARAVRPGDGHRRLQPPVQRRRPRDPPRDRPPLPRHRPPRRAGRRRRAVHALSCAATPGSRARSTRCLRRHGLPRTPADLGLSDEQFAEAVLAAPSTRPDRFTILEHLDLGRRGGEARVSARSSTPSIAELRAATQPAVDLRAQQRRALGGPPLHAARVAVPDAAADPARRLTPNGVTWLMIVVGVARRRRCSRCRGVAAGDRRGRADPAADPARLLRRRARPLAPALLAGRASTSTGSATT